MSALDALVRQWLGEGIDRALPTFVLLSLRALPLAFVAPWLGWKGTATYARASVAIVVALALTPLALSTAPALPASGLALALLGVREVLIGVAFAIASSLPLWALGWTGELVDRWRGSSPDATAIGPSDAASPLGVLHLTAGVVLFVTLGGHRLALAAFGEGLIDAPVGAGASGELRAFALGTGRLVTASLELAVAFAAPAAIAFVLLEIVLGLAARIGPELRLYASALPLRAGLGIAAALVGLSALLPRLSPLFAGSIEAAGELVRGLGG